MGLLTFSKRKRREKGDATLFDLDGKPNWEGWGKMALVLQKTDVGDIEYRRRSSNT
jgi:hypothetical protein